MLRSAAHNTSYLTSAVISMHGSGALVKFVLQILAGIKLTEARLPTQRYFASSGPLANLRLRPRLAGPVSTFKRPLFLWKFFVAQCQYGTSFVGLSVRIHRVLRPRLVSIDRNEF